MLSDNRMNILALPAAATSIHWPARRSSIDHWLLIM
jgi:hypothetical protein